jgi:hypothetical protein
LRCAWAEEDSRESFELTMASDELTGVIRRLHDYTAGALHVHVLREKEEEQIAARQVAACAAYRALLARLAEDKGAATADATAGTQEESR